MRGRPRSFDAEAGVAAAQALFAREGFDAVGVADLCRLLGVKPPSLYAAYGSKRGLFEQAIAHYGAVTGEAYGAAIAGASDLASLRRAVLETALELYLRDGGQGCMVLSNLAATGDADLRAMLAGIVTDRRAAMTARARAIGATEAEAHETVAAISVAMMGLSAGVRSGMDAETLRVGLRQLL